MAIKVYKSNVASGNIGVNVAGANTTASSFASLSNTFNSFANNMFNEAGKLAQKEGLQAAQEATLANILQINKDTGNPVAYQEEGIYGSIFTDAFNEIIDRRYVSGIQEDLINVNKKLATKYSLNLQGYQNAFTEYYTGKINGANPKWKNIVTEQSESLITGTSITIANNIAAYEKKQAELQLAYEVNKEKEMAYELGSSGASFNKFTEFLFNLSDKTNFRTVGITTTSEMAEHKKQVAYLYLISKLKNSISALPKTQIDPNLIKALPNYVRRSIDSMGTLPMPFIDNPNLTDLYQVVSAINNMQFDKDDHEKIIKQINSSDEALNKEINDWIKYQEEKNKKENAILNEHNLSVLDANVRNFAKLPNNWYAGGDEVLNQMLIEGLQIIKDSKSMKDSDGKPLKDAQTRIKTSIINTVEDLGQTITRHIADNMANDFFRTFRSVNEFGDITVSLDKDVVNQMKQLESDIKRFIENGLPLNLDYLSEDTKKVMNQYQELFGPGDNGFFGKGITDDTYTPKEFKNFSVQSLYDSINNRINLSNEYLKKVADDQKIAREEAIVAGQNLVDQYLVMNDIASAEAMFLEVDRALESYGGFDAEKKNKIREEIKSKLGSFRLSEVIREKYGYDVPVDKLEAVVNYLETGNLDTIYNLDPDLYSTIKELNFQYGDIDNRKENIKAFLAIQKEKTIETQKRLNNLTIANDRQTGRVLGDTSTISFLKTISPQESTETFAEYEERIKQDADNYLLWLTDTRNMNSLFVDGEVKEEVISLAKYGNFPFQELFEVLDVYYDGREDVFPQGSSIEMPLKLLQEFIRHEDGNLLSPQFLTDVTTGNKNPWVSFINYIDKNPQITGADGVLLTGDDAIKQALKKYKERIDSGFVEETLKQRFPKQTLKEVILEKTDLDPFGPVINSFEDIITSAIAVEGLASKNEIVSAIKDLEENIFPKSSIVFENINNLNSENNTMNSLEKLTGQNTNVVVNEMLMKQILPATQNIQINYNGQLLKLSDFPFKIGDYKTFEHDFMSIEKADVFKERSQLQNRVDAKPPLRLHVNSLQNQRDREEWDRLYSNHYNPDGTLKDEKKVALYPPIEFRLMPLNNELPNDIMLETNLGHPSNIDDQVFYATKDNKKYAVFFKMPEQSWNEGLPLMETVSAVQMDATTLHHYKTIADGTYMERPGISNNTVFGALVPNTNIVKYHIIPKIYDGKIYPDRSLKDLKVIHDRLLQDYKLEEFPSFYNLDDAIFWLKENRKKWSKEQITVEEAKDIIEKNGVVFQEAVTVDPLAINRKYDEINAFKDEVSAKFDASLNDVIIRDIATFDYESDKLIENYFTNNFEENYAPIKPSLTFNRNFLSSKRKQKQWERKYGEYFDADGTLKTGITIFPLLLEEYNKIISINGLPSTHPKFYKKGLNYWEMWKRNYFRSFPVGREAERKGLLLSE